MPLTNTPETLNILNPDFRMPEHCGGDRWSILHGDSLQIIRQFEPNSFDAIITDPPYASGGSSQTTKNRSTNEKYSSMSKDKALPDFDSDQMVGGEKRSAHMAHGYSAGCGRSNSTKPYMAAISYCAGPQRL